MLDKQDRYRKRKSQQGFQRVEVLVPEAAVPLIKAYARALRDAHSLGLDAPLFDGMGRQADKRPGGATLEEQAPKPPAQNTKPAPGERVTQPAKSAQSKNPESSPARARPDFSTGLLRK